VRLEIAVCGRPAAIIDARSIRAPATAAEADDFSDSDGASFLAYGQAVAKLGADLCA